MSERTDKAREQRRQNRKRFFEMYGGKCACCGLADIRFLTLGHVKNDGSADRRGRRDHTQVYARAIKKCDPSRYEIQCFNCQGAAEKFNGICPHKLDRIGDSRRTPK